VHDRLCDRVEGAIASLGGFGRLCLGVAVGAVAMLGCALAADAPRERVETVSFADPRWPAVKVVRGIPLGKTSVKAPITAPTPAAAALPRVVVARTEIVTFGDGRGDRVVVMRGATATPAQPNPRERLAGLGPSPVAILRGSEPVVGGLSLFGAANGGELDRVAFAVDGAESGHGSNPAMWRAEFGGPQGPMQVSAAAALDVGGGDRFDMRQNRLLGRAYLAKLYGRYGNWPDAIAAYNWGPGNLDQWIVNGRPVDALPLETARYLLKVLRDALLLGPS
jgi:hypothetical protein